MPQTTLNQAILNAIRIESYKEGHIKTIMPLLNKLSSDIEMIILRIDTSSQRDVANALKQINTKIDSTFSRIETLCYTEYKDLIKYSIEQEISPIRGLLQDDADISFTEREMSSAIALVLLSFIMGKKFNQHITDLKVNLKAQVASQIRIGITDNEEISSISKRVRGTKTRRFNDGIFSATLRNVDAVLRTSIQSFVNNAKQFAWKKFSLNKYIWISVLDAATTPICGGRSNKIYVVGMGPIPPAHYRCRSIILLYRKGMKVPPSYSQWLKAQPKDVVTSILGKTKAKIFLSGQLPLDKFTANNGRKLTIKELVNLK